MLVFSARRFAALLGDWRGGGPRPAEARAALSDRIRLLILDGRLPLGARLPAERELAAALQLSRTTVSAAYASLRDAGYLHSVRGSGSVAVMPDGVPAAAGGSESLLDFAKAALPAAEALAEAAVAAAAELPAYLAGSGYDPVGLPSLREAIAARYRARGLPTDADQVMVTIGAQHAIARLAGTLLSGGDTAMVEAPSYPHACEALAAACRRLVTVPVTAAGGWDDDALQQTLRRTNPAVAYLMPDFHNPTGAVMPAEQRERTLFLAQRQGTVVVADETMAELNIDLPPGELPLPLAAYGPAVLIGSLGKTVWGGLRIGWIRAEPALIRQLVQARYRSDLGTPVLEQLIAVRLLEQYEDVLAARSAQLRRGRDLLEGLLRTELPDWQVPHVRGGLTTWVELPLPVSSALTLAARTRGLQLAAGPAFGSGGIFERFLRIPFSYSAEETCAAVRTLHDVWQSVGGLPVGRLPDPQPQVV